MFGLIKKGVKAVGMGSAQAQLGIQSPHLPSALVRWGRFLYTVSVGWIGITWYTGYVNAHTLPGSGPTLVLPGSAGRLKSLPARNDPAVPSFGTSGIGSSGTITPSKGGVNTNVAAISGKPYGALTIGRTDQGVDFSSSGRVPVGAVADGKIIRLGAWPGWPDAGGGRGIVYHTQYGNIYVMETFNALPSLKVGDTIKKGQVIGYSLGAIPGSTGIETGFANSAGTAPLTPYNGSPDGTPMPGGLAFRHLLGYK